MSFEIGAHVRTRAKRPSGHTRLPRYLAGKTGVVVAELGAFPLPDERAQGVAARSEALLTVSFRAEDVWGEPARPGDTLRADLFESYLEADR